MQRRALSRATTRRRLLASRARTVPPRPEPVAARRRNARVARGAAANGASTRPMTRLTAERATAHASRVKRASLASASSSAKVLPPTRRTAARVATHAPWVKPASPERASSSAVVPSAAIPTQGPPAWRIPARSARAVAHGGTATETQPADAKPTPCPTSTTAAGVARVAAGPTAPPRAWAANVVWSATMATPTVTTQRTRDARSTSGQTPRTAERAGRSACSPTPVGTASKACACLGHAPTRDMANTSGGTATAIPRPAARRT